MDRALTISTEVLSVIFAGLALKREKLTQRFQVSFPSPGDRKQFLNTSSLYNKTGSLFLEFNRMRKTFQLLKKIVNSVT